MTTPTPEGALPALGGRYRLVERIARGGMGEVWRAFDEVLSRPVAVKVLRPEYADEEVFLERFRNEARNTAALVHTGIAGVYDFGQASLARTVVPFIVMELVPGQPLSQIIERDGALDIDRALDLCAQAGRALHAAHLGGVVHRDVKPANLLITPTWTVKITDFGIARAGDTVPLTRTGTVMGTAHYLAPELVNGRGVASPASDTYALGVVLYECLAGRRPFLGDNPLAVAMEHLNSTPPEIAGLHPAVADVLKSVLAKDPMARPPSAEAFAHRLLALRIELSAAVPTPDTVRERPRRTRRPGRAAPGVPLPASGPPAAPATAARRPRGTRARSCCRPSTRTSLRRTSRPFPRSRLARVATVPARRSHRCGAAGARRRAARTGSGRTARQSSPAPPQRSPCSSRSAPCGWSSPATIRTWPWSRRSQAPRSTRRPARSRPAASG